MRKIRQRFTKSRTRTFDPGLRTLNGKSRYKNSIAGRSAKFDAMCNQRAAQSGLCADCNQSLPVDNMRFRDRRFTVGQPNPVIHERCPAKPKSIPKSIP